MSISRVLTLNSGSSSLKFSVYEFASGEGDLLLHGKLERIGSNKGHFTAFGIEEKVLADEAVDLPDHQHALDLLLQRLPSFGIGSITAVGHRIVQGGQHHFNPEIVRPALLQELEDLCSLDPPHLPAALKALKAVEALGQNLPQVVCFDTSFHRRIPAVAQRLPLPRRLTEGTGLLRYGFHGLSYEYIVGELEHRTSAEVARGKLIIAHLGNGASMAAVQDGKSVETTMGFTPAGGLVMGSRSGDLDPGVLAYLLEQGLVAPADLSDFIYRQTGLLGISELSADLRDLMAVRTTNVQAQEAIDLFCYQARKTLGSLVAVLDGLETLIFTGGIGENIGLLRTNICAGLHHLGLRLDDEANEHNRAVISSSESRVTVRVMKTNEELVIARHTARLIFQA